MLFCFVLFRQSLKDEYLSDLLIILITLDSAIPVFFSISSKVTRSAQAAHMTQSGSFIFG
jgi:hypothetical protein